MEKHFVALDPGMKNLALWAGTVGPDGSVRTANVGKFDITEGGKALYDGAADLVLSLPWVSDPDQVAGAVVETQAPRNVPARIVATAVYGVLRGRGIPCKFSGSALKRSAMAVTAKRLGEDLEPPPPKGKGRAKLLHAANKRNARVLLSALSREDAKLSKYAATLKKRDDVADAVLLGIGLCAEVRSPPATERDTS